MGEGSASRSGTGQEPEGWPRAGPATISDLERSFATLTQITRQVQAQRSVDPGDAAYIRSLVYWHLWLLASLLRPISDSVRVILPRKAEDVDKVELAVRPILTKIVALFGFEQNIVYFIDDDDSYTTAEQIRQIVELQEHLSVTIADYLDVAEGIDKSGPRKSKVRKEFIAAFRQLQDKIDMVVGELWEWRS